MPNGKARINQKPQPMTHNFLYNVYRLYADGFKHMRLGRVLWAIILIKLFVIFVILKLLFFPDVLKREARDGDKAGYVATQRTDRAADAR